MNNENKEIKNDKHGFVYVLSNPAYKGLLKVGWTTRTPEERAKELYKTGVPDKFNVEYKVEFENAENAEEQVHSLLKAYRHSQRREFFTCSLKIIKEAIDKADGKIETSDGKNDWVKILIAIIIFLLLLIILLPA